MTFGVLLKGSDLAPGAAPSTLFSIGSSTTIDVWSLELGKIVHIFETKKDRIKRLDFLLVKKGNHLVVVADEDKEGACTSSVIHIRPETSGTLF
jgi:WD40 repeat protein